MNIDNVMNMKLTAERKQIIRDNKLQAFYLDAVHYFEEEHQAVLEHHKIKWEALFNQLKKNYLHLEFIGRASQLDENQWDLSSIRRTQGGLWVS
nr:hypothetical protein [Providencia stuartii]